MWNYSEKSAPIPGGTSYFNLF